MGEGTTESRTGTASWALGRMHVQALWFANICPLLNKCSSFHSSSALASFVIVYILMNGIESVHYLNGPYINVYGTGALWLAWEIRELTQKKGESQAPHTACKIQINHYDVCLDASVRWLYMCMLWLPPFSTHPTFDWESTFEGDSMWFGASNCGSSTVGGEVVGYIRWDCKWHFSTWDLLWLPESLNLHHPVVVIQL